MNHRHLYPNEFDLLLDGDAGFGLAPLKAHARRCAECRAELDEARRVVLLLDELPHLAPAPRFADRVMAQVQPFEPWHVTLRDTARGFVPRSRPAQLLAGAGAFATALVLSVGAVVLLGRLDLLVFGWGVLADRSRTVVVDAVGGLVAAVFGDAAVGALTTVGSGVVLLAVASLMASVIIAALFLRALTAASRRQRL